MACGVAKEMIQRLLGCHKPGPFEAMMGEVLHLSGALKEARVFMSKIRVASHQSIGQRDGSASAIDSKIANDIS